MKIIGLTGGIASGKSLVAGILEELGAVVIDADQLAREVVKPGKEPLRMIVESFGESILQPDGTLDRKALGRIVFSDPDARALLERITHPAIIRLAEERLAGELRKGTETVFYMVPLLLEAGLASSVDEIWVVYADNETQVERLMKRDRIERDEALRKIDAQMPMDEKIRFGKVIIDNRGTPEGTRRKVTELWEEVKKSETEGVRRKT